MYRYLRQYKGPLKACILDWSGTVCDRYVMAPAVVFRDVFEKHGVPITMAEARLPMGLRKDLHIGEIIKIKSVRDRWYEHYNREPNATDVENIFKDFVPLQLACLDQYATLLPGVKKSMHALRHELHLKIGMTTGFTREMVNVLLKETRQQGFIPDCTVAGDEVIHGARPAPFMVYKNMDLLGVYPIQAVVKVDDTVGGVGEGLEAGCWTVGVSRFSNYMNIDNLDHKLSWTELQERNEESRKKLEQAGAHYVIDTISDLPNVVKEINNRMTMGDAL